jgi:RNA polymerase sigma-70 factor (ECF subfamily)
MQKAQASAATTSGEGGIALDDLSRRRLSQVSKEHGAYLRDLSQRLCRGQFDADDLVQDVLVSAALQLHKLPADTNLIAWLTRVMKNRFIDRCRRKQTGVVATPATPIDEERIAARINDPEEWWEKLDADDIRARLGELPTELREAFELFAFRDRSYQEIAAELGIPKATVGTRILRARQRLRILLLADRPASAGASR